MAYQIDYMWHPTHKSNDIVAAEKFFKDVFDRPSLPVEVCLPPTELSPGYPRDYSILTPIQEVMFDCIDPKKYVVEGRQTFEDVSTPHLFCLGWAATGVEEIYKVCVEHGIRSTDQANRLGSSTAPPVTGFSTNDPLFFTLPESTGLRYQIYPLSASGPPHPQGVKGWKLPPVRETDPLSLEFCSHHTILTSNPIKGLNFLVGILKGKIIHKGRNELLETDSTYISLGDGVYELAVPTRAGSFAAEDLKFNWPFDTYHSLTYKVQDLKKAERHLKDKNIRMLFSNENTIITNPEDTIGIPWGFTDKLTPGDFRLPG
ncbi:hypothetical protein OIDMADRAFT_60453 [Oidiodendron maius Zn]|uniref:VOC domain-containing protein n=1 Tax=Oidiodendron maius (strain Zn) TaxID=913774 RepID=A0A0C3GWM0_OIDMZ|nr:hypothetical protein OIDMADRAFT_60453 [Oidiodendron maius Zn]